MKTRADAKLKTLPEARQDAIADYARDHTLRDTVAWLKEDGIETSAAALSQFLSWYQLRQQLAQNESTVETLLEDLKKTNPNISEEQLDLAGQVFFTTLAIDQKDSLTWQRAQNVKIKKDSIKLEGRRIALLEKKAAAYDRAQAALENAKSSKGGITPETLSLIERELKLL